MGVRGFSAIALSCIGLVLVALLLHPHAASLKADRTWARTIPASISPCAAPALTAKAAYLGEASSGQELYSLNPDLELPNASTTKILTAALAIQKGRLDRTITASKTAADTEPANIVMKPGEKFTLRDLLYAMMIHSANDAAELVAEAVGPSTPEFVELMNSTAKKLSCDHTHFVTPNGLNDKEHYTTSRDLFTLTRYALSIPLFNTLIRTHSYRIHRSINQKNVVMHRAHGDRFLFKYPGADGVKTGYTHQAGRCYVGAATHTDACGPRRLITVVLHAKDTYADTAALMDYGFKAWTRIPATDPGEQLGIIRAPGVAPLAVEAATTHPLLLRTDQPHTIVYSYHVFARAPVRIHSRIGTLSVSVDGGPRQSVPVIAADTVALPSSYRRVQGVRLAFCVAALLALGCSYGSYSKAHRRRRNLLSAQRRILDSRGESYPQWACGGNRRLR